MECNSVESREGQGDLGERHRRKAKHKEEEKSSCRGLTYIKKAIYYIVRNS